MNAISPTITHRLTSVGAKLDFPCVTSLAKAIRMRTGLSTPILLHAHARYNDALDDDHARFVGLAPRWYSTSVTKLLYDERTDALASVDLEVGDGMSLHALQQLHEHRLHRQILPLPCADHSH